MKLLRLSKPGITILLAALFIIVDSSCGKRDPKTRPFPTETEVQERLHVGMTRNEVVELFGSPAQEFPAEDRSSRMIYISPAFFSPGPRPPGYTGFQVFLTGGKVTKWSRVEGEVR